MIKMKVYKGSFNKNNSVKAKSTPQEKVALKGKSIKSIAGTRIGENFYKLEIKQSYEENDEQKSINLIVNYFNSKEELYEAIISNLRESNSLKYHTILGENIIALTSGYAYLDKNKKYLPEDKAKLLKNKYTNIIDLKSPKGKSKIEAGVDYKYIKSPERVKCIKLRTQPLDKFFETPEKEAADFKEYILKKFIKEKNIAGEKIRLHIRVSAQDDIDSDTYNLFNDMISDKENGKNIFEDNKYSEIFYAKQDLKQEYIDSEENIVNQLSGFDNVILKYKTNIYQDKNSGKYIRVYNSESYKSADIAMHKLINRVAELKKTIFVRHEIEYTIFKDVKTSTIIICLYKIPEENLNLEGIYYDVEKIEIPKIVEELEKIEEVKAKKQDLEEENKVEHKKDKLEDENKLEKPSSDEFKVLRDEHRINYFIHYHPYWENGHRNQSFGENDALILRLKEQTARDVANKEEVLRMAQNEDDEDIDILDRFIYESYKEKTLPSEFFFNKIKTTVKNSVKKYKDVAITIVPSHSINSSSPGMEHLVKLLCDYTGAENCTGLLERYKTINKLSHGGKRDKDTHYSSIRVNGTTSKKKIFLLDDVTTTGNSLLACKRLLENQGYEVICVALAKTKR